MEILVIQFREDESLLHEQQCFSRLSKKHKNISFHYLNIFTDYKLLESSKNIIKQFDKVVLGGCGDLYLVQGKSDADYEKVEFIKQKIYPLIGDLLRLDFPLLGICFGFQLIVDYLGHGMVDDDEHREIGIFEIDLTEAGQQSRLFDGLPNPFHAVNGHRDSLPVGEYDGLNILATTEKCVHAFQYKHNVYGTQFHCELDHKDLQYRLNLYSAYKTNAASDAETCEEALVIFENFIKM